MARQFALRAEVLDRLDDPGAEEGLPVAVDDDSAGQGVGRVDDPSSQAQPVGRRVLGQRRQERGHRRAHLVAVLVVLAAGEDEGVARLLHLLHDHRRRHFALQLGARLDQPGQLLAHPVWGCSSIALEAGKPCWLEAALAALNFTALRSAGVAAADTASRTSVSTALPFSERPGPLATSESSGSASTRIAVIPFRSA